MPNINFSNIVKPVSVKLAGTEKLFSGLVKTEFESINFISSHILNTRGKMLRPALLLLCAGVFGRIKQIAVSAAASVELMHTATLVHDDIIDNSAMRRGCESVNYKYGNAGAVLFGDYLYCQSFKVLGKFNDKFIAENLISVAAKMCQGELQQSLNSFKYDDCGMPLEEYISLIKNKTAYFMAVCGKIGAYCSGASVKYVNLIENYGINLGIAFQITDDIFDWESKTDNIGKPVGNDLKEGKITLPLMLLIDKSAPSQKKEILGIISSKNINSEVISKLKKLMGEYGCIADARKMAGGYSKLAKDIILSLKIKNKYSESLIELCDFVVSRNK